jgi:hypothetical protein
MTSIAPSIEKPLVSPWRNYSRFRTATRVTRLCRAFETAALAFAVLAAEANWGALLLAGGANAWVLRAGSMWARLGIQVGFGVPVVQAIDR